MFVAWMALFGNYPTALLLGLLACAPVSLSASVAVIWTPDQDEAPTLLRLLLWAAVAMEVFLIGVAVVEVARNLMDASTFGIDAHRDAARLAAAGVGTLLLVGCLRVPLMRAVRPEAGASHPRLPRVASLVGIAVATTLFLGAVAGAAISRHTLRCSPFSFDKERWDAAGMGSDRVRIGTALARCGTLEGKTRAEVTELLHLKPAQKRVVLYSRWDGWDQHTSILNISYGGDGRVRGAKVASTNMNAD